MSIWRQLALASLLVVGTAWAASAYFGGQRGAAVGAPETAAPILEFGPSYRMARPLRAGSEADETASGRRLEPRQRRRAVARELGGSATEAGLRTRFGGAGAAEASASRSEAEAAASETETWRGIGSARPGEAAL